MMSNSVDPKEIQAFSKDSAHWWDEDGPFAPLHRLNPVRMAYIREQVCSHFDLSDTALKPFERLTLLDIGCGGGLACENLARLGASVTGVDADATAIDVAQDHARKSGLEIDYRNDAAENLNAQYDVVLALEIIEHVTDPAVFVKSCAALVKPGGLIIFSTLNRTPKSYALGIVAAEYLLRWVPRGTHTWKKFVKPSELASYARQAELDARDVSGLVFRPLQNEFRISQDDLSVNYFLSVAALPKA